MSVAILYPGDRAGRDLSDPARSRFAALFSALADRGIKAKPAVYNDDFAHEVEEQLQRVRAVLVWYNPIEGGRPRHVLDAMLRRIAARGTFVSAHPDVILRMGTKDVLVDVRGLPFGSDCHRVSSLGQLQTEVPVRLELGPRVLKQHRGHSGLGVWRIERLGADHYGLQHAQRGSEPEEGAFAKVLQRLEPYFADGGHMVDQPWQPRLKEGMVRAYLVRDRVAGFGHQAINALYPSQPGEPATPPGPRLYSAPDDARFQRLRQLLESEWVELLRQKLDVGVEQLPLLWDADFLHGNESGYVLCELNVSSVSPYPESATGEIVRAVQTVLAQ